MHIPDGFLSPEVAGATAVATLAAVGYGLKTASDRLDERRVPLLGVTGAFIFAAQMLNFPVAGARAATSSAPRSRRSCSARGSPA